jgi:hypothetical protein
MLLIHDGAFATAATAVGCVVAMRAVFAAVPGVSEGSLRAAVISPDLKVRPPKSSARGTEVESLDSA